MGGPYASTCQSAICMRFFGPSLFLIDLLLPGEVDRGVAVHPAGTLSLPSDMQPYRLASITLDVLFSFSCS